MFGMRPAFVIALIALAAGLVVLSPAVRRGLPVAASGASAAPPSDTKPEQGLRRERAIVGVFLPRESAEVAAMFTGRVANVYVRTGDSMRQGDVIASIDARLLERDIALAQATVKANEIGGQLALVDKSLSDNLYARKTAMDAEGLVSGEALEASKHDHAAGALKVQAAEAAVTQHRAELESLMVKRSYMDIRAPFDGTVVARYVNPGSNVETTTPIVRLISASRLFLRFAVEPERARKLFVGAKVRAEWDAERDAVVGSVARIAPEVDEAVHMVFVEADIEDGAKAPLAGTSTQITSDGQW
jgi:RND family efflux transporter MFP subunit